MDILSPGATENVVLFYTNVALTVVALAAVLQGSATPSVTYSVRYGADISAPGTEIVTGGSTVTSVTAGAIVTTFTQAAIPLGSWVWLTTSAQSGTVTALHVTVLFQ